MPWVPLCVVIILHIGCVIALTWKNVSTQIIACEHETVTIIWEYDLIPGEYVKAKTWFTGFNKTARRIAYWKDTDGSTIESQYKDRVTMTGNNSLILRDVTTYDEGPYTLIPSFPLSSEPDPRLTVYLTIFISPLKEAGCCKPDINASLGELRAFLHSTLACGKPTPTLNWTISRNKTVSNGSLMLGTKDKAGTYKVCVYGPAVDKCFTGDKEDLCKPFTVESLPERDDLKAHDSNQAMTMGISITVVVVTIAIAVFVAVILYRRAQRSRKRLEEQLPFISPGKNVSGVTSLTVRLIDIYTERPQFRKADSDLKLKVKLLSGSSNEPDIDINSYRNVICMHGEPLKRILITGEVGCGKKTWCNSLTQDWCNAQSKNVSDTDHENIKFLRDFKLLFNVSLKNVKRLSKINELLLHLRIPVFDTSNMDIGKLLRDYKTIFVIQGLEEYDGSPEEIKHILSAEHLQESLIIATSTPTLWDSKYKKIISFDRVISVQGLDPDEMKKRAERILQNHGFHQKAIEKFFSLITERGLKDFTTEPIFYPSLVTMWQTNCSLPCNNADFLLNVIENKIKRKSPFLQPNTSKYRSDLGNSLVFINKEFTLHYGKVLQVIGEIAFNILCMNNEHVTFDEKQFDTAFISQDCNDEETKQFTKEFCVSIGLVSKEEDGNVHIFSFRHIMLQTFLAALYVSTLEKEHRIKAAKKLESANNFSDFLKFMNPN